NLNVRMDAIVNDSSAILLSQAYNDPSTRLALILGTGTNAAVHLPVSALGKSKFENRPQSWHEKADHVIVNTELSMFGKNILPTTRWDDYLNITHMNPDFQPLEYLISGRYLGEIVRLILLEAIQAAGLFGGEVPEQFINPYTLDTGTIAAIES
ncbi:N-acetylglucosamine kinase 1, partial [Cryomyces antarcticus]